jgi:hypothetical protein
MDERHLPFVFVPDGAEVPASWRAAHPDALSLPARLVVPGRAQKIQFVVPIPAPPPPVGLPGHGHDRTRELLRWLKDQWPGILRTEPDDERWIRPPPDSVPIDKTRWSGNHGKIKGAIGADPDDNVRIAPDGTVWGENPDGTWTNHGPAENFIEGSRPAGRRGKDRDDRRGLRRRD